MRTRHIVAGSAVFAALVLVIAFRSPSSSPPQSSAEPLASAAPRADVDAAAATFAVQFQSGAYRLRGDILKPEGTGPFPVVVYNHGSEPDPGLDYLGKIGAFFQSHGYVAFFPYRRGSGGSEGPYWQDEVKKRPQAEEHEAAVAQLDAQSDDVLAAVTWIRDQPYVDRGHVAVAGCSFGGIESVLAAERATGIYAAVDFAGASMAWAGSPPLQARLKASVRAARVPIFFLQAENDFDTTPSLVLSREMVEAGKSAVIKIFPPHGTTPMAGHAGFCTRGMKEWGNDVLAFLENPRTTNPE